MRAEKGIQPFTVMSCDNIPGNGHVTENTVCGLAKLSDPPLQPGCMRMSPSRTPWLTALRPATGKRGDRPLATEFGIDDNWPVFCEEFKQWVMEDNFPAGRPALEKVGVQFVPDVAPYELMKIRILNGGHARLPIRQRFWISISCMMRWCIR